MQPEEPDSTNKRMAANLMISTVERGGGCLFRTCPGRSGRPCEPCTQKVSMQMHDSAFGWRRRLHAMHVRQRCQSIRPLKSTGCR